MDLTVDEMVHATGAEVVSQGHCRRVGTVLTDSRGFQSGAWFVAIAGPHFDGHAYINDVIDQGAEGVIVSSEATHALKSTNPWVLQVKDTTAALGAIAGAWRQKNTDTTYIGITGSNGKTTTKEMIASVAASRGPVLKTVGNYNNLIGMPQTLFRLEPSDAIAVVELGMNMAGEIAQLTKALDPDVGVITNVTAAHLESLHTIENVAKAKGELFKYMRADGTIVVNQEDPWVCQLAERYPGQKITFGMSNGCDVQFGRVSSDGLGESTLTLYIDNTEYHTTIPLPGTHNVMNALAATASGLALNIAPQTIMDRLPQFTPMRMRMERVQLENGVQVINDSYNANPESVEAALRTVGAAKRAGRFFAVLGDMLELGPSAEQRHHDIGTLLATYHVDQVFTLGEYATAVANGARESGMINRTIFDGGTDKAAVQQAVKELVQHGDVVLVKGSRGMQMEEVVEYLKLEIGVS